MASQTAPDSGWGWMVVFGTILVNVLVIGHSRSCGVYSESLVQELNASPSSLAWLQSLQISMFSFLAPVASILSQFIGPRNVALLGCFLAFFWLIVSAFNLSLNILYITFGIIQGISLTFTFTPGITMIAQYFYCRRGLANGLTMAGNAFGGIVMPFLAHQLLSHYSLRGCFLIMGSLLLNSCVGVLLWHPIEWHQKKNQIQITVTQDTNDQNGLIPEPNGDLNKSLDLNNFSDVKMESESMSTTKNEPNISPLPNFLSVNIIVPDVIVNTTLQEQSKSMASLQDGNVYLSVPNGIVQRDRGGSVPHLTNPSKSEGKNYGVSGLTESLPNVSHQCSKPLKLNSKSSFVYVSSYSLGPPIGAILTKNHLTSSMSMDSAAEFKNRNTSKISNLLCLRNFAIDKSIFENSQFYILTVSLFFHALGYPGTQIFLPYRVTMMGLSNTHSATLLSVFALADLVGRIFCAWISDFHFCQRKYWFIGGMLTSGLFAFSLPFYKSLTTLLVGTAGFGFCCGAYIGLVVVLFADIYAPEKVALVYSISTVTGGIMALAGPPITGYVFECTGSYLICQLILGFAQCAGAIVWFIEPWLDRYLQRRCKQEILNVSETENLF